MRCAWKELLSVLPIWMRRDVDRYGKDTLQELRLRLGLPPELITNCGSKFLNRVVTGEDLSWCINTASHYSPWAAQSMAQGYLTCPGGHRMGLCGDAVMQQGRMLGIRAVRSLCIRVARDLEGISSGISDDFGSVLILGPPGSGKTTLLRDLIRRISKNDGGSVAVVDERGELFPVSAFDSGPRTDILTGCGKPAGIDAVLRTMGPGYIAVDEITAEEDCQALIQAGWCGVKLLATAHASSREDLLSRPVYQPLVRSRLFDTLVILRSDKSMRTERMMQL